MFLAYIFVFFGIFYCLFSKNLRIKMLSCSFYGNREKDYFPYGRKIETIIIDLIEDCGLTQFYSGYRGEFERFCAYIVSRLKEKYPFIQYTMVLSYSRQINLSLSPLFDDSVYLLKDTPPPPRYAIPRTNQKLVDLSNYIISGVNHDSGGAFTACNYAQKHRKLIISIYDELIGKKLFFTLSASYLRFYTVYLPPYDKTSVQAQSFVSHLPAFSLYCENSNIIQRGEVTYDTKNCTPFQRYTTEHSFYTISAIKGKTITFSVPFISSVTNAPDFRIKVAGKTVEGEILYGDNVPYFSDNFDISAAFSQIRSSVSSKSMGTLYFIYV